MKVTNVELNEKEYYEEETFLPYLLKNNIDNEKFFQKVFFDITIEELDHPMDFVYRYFYEDIYLHNHDIDGVNSGFSVYVNRDVLHLRPSLSELVGYINMAAPPLILNLIKSQGYKDIDEFISVLKELLIQERIRVPYYTMKFKECMGMNHFSTKTTYNFERMDTLRQINGQACPLVDVEAINGVSIERLARHDLDFDLYVDHLQCMINVINKKQVEEVVLSIIDDLEGDASIINVYIDPDKGYFVELNIPDFYTKRNPNLMKLIKESYSKLYE